MPVLAEVVDVVQYDSLRRRVRIILLLHGSEEAGIAPIPLRRLHTYAYLSNVLAPVWDTRVFDGQLLKRRGGPFYPALQHDLDRLIGMGLVLITGIRHIIDDDNQWKLDGACSLNRELAGDALTVLRSFPQELELQAFLLEIAYAVSALKDTEFDLLPGADPTYSDSSVGYENVVDFDSWRKVNYSTNVARHFAAVLENATRGELLHLYARQLVRMIDDEPQLH